LRDIRQLPINRHLQCDHLCANKTDKGLSTELYFSLNKIPYKKISAIASFKTESRYGAKKYLSN
jgi:hypothetical protein